MILTAGLVAVHRPCAEYGVDELDGLGQEPAVQRLRTAAQQLGQEVWLRVASPAGQQIPEPINGLDIIARWTSVLWDGAAAMRPREMGPSGDGNSAPPRDAGRTASA